MHNRACNGTLGKSVGANVKFKRYRTCKNENGTRGGKGKQLGHDRELVRTQKGPWKGQKGTRKLRAQNGRC